MATTAETLIVNIQAKLDQATRATAAYQRQLDELAEGTTVPVTIKGGRDLDALFAKVSRLDAESATVLIGIEMAQAQRQVGDLIYDISRLDASDPTIEVKTTQLAQARGDLDAMEAKVKELNATPIDLGGGAAVGGGKRAIDDITDSARGANSALANMVGNSAQDLGQLGGVAGSTGVAIGQIAEYASDAALGGERLGSSLASMAMVAGPIAAIAIAIQSVQAIMARFSDSSARTSDNVDQLTESMREGDSAAEAYAERVQEVGQVTLDNVRAQSTLTNVVSELASSWVAVSPALKIANDLLGRNKDEVENITPTLVKAGLALEDWTNYVTRGTDGAAELQTALAASNLSADEQESIMTALGQAQEDVGTAALSAAEAEAFFGTAVEDNSAAIEANNAKLTEARERRREFADAVKLANAGLANAIDDADAFGAALERVNAASGLDFSRMALDTVGAFDSMKDSLRELQGVAVDWSTVDLTPDSVDELRGIPDELAAVTDSIGGMRDSIQTELAAAFETGGIDAYTAKAEFFRAQVLDQFPAAFREAGAGAAEADAAAAQLADELGLMPSDIQIMIELTREEEARAALDAFSSVISEMPENVQVDINAAIAEGDIEGALSILNSQLINRGYDPITLPVDADTAPAAEEVHGFASGEQPAATVPIEGDTAPAEGERDAFVDDTDRTQTTVGVDASTALAAAVLLAWLSIPRTTKVYVGTEGIPEVDRALDLVAAPRRAPIEAYLSDYPTAAEIQRAIGTVRVPVVAETQRLTGTRDP